jgi:hypothetical protein
VARAAGRIAEALQPAATAGELRSSPVDSQQSTATTNQQRCTFNLSIIYIDILYFPSGLFLSLLLKRMKRRQNPVLLSIRSRGSAAHPRVCLPHAPRTTSLSRPASTAIRNPLFPFHFESNRRCLPPISSDTSPPLPPPWLLSRLSLPHPRLLQAQQTKTASRAPSPPPCFRLLVPASSHRN